MIGYHNGNNGRTAMTKFETETDGRQAIIEKC